MIKRLLKKYLFALTVLSVAACLSLGCDCAWRADSSIVSLSQSLASDAENASDEVSERSESEKSASNEAFENSKSEGSSSNEASESSRSEENDFVEASESSRGEENASVETSESSEEKSENLGVGLPELPY